MNPLQVDPIAYLFILIALALFLKLMGDVVYWRSRAAFHDELDKIAHEADKIKNEIKGVK